MNSTLDSSPSGPHLERSESDELDTGRLIAGKYRLGRLIGEGGMGSVYEAEHLGLGTKVAVKILGERSLSDSVSQMRFRREARAAAAVRHPNVVTVTDAGTDDEGVPFLVMEMLEGENLSAILKRQRQLSPRIGVAIASQILAGLEAAHARGVIHRDLKPANIFLERREDGTRRAKILDFGISKFADARSLEVTRDGSLVGTPHFMAPEQLLRTRTVDKRGDIYALGVLLYRMLTGRMPYSVFGPESFEAQIRNAEIVPPSELIPEISEELSDVVLESMAFDPNKRFQDAGTFRSALRAAMPGRATPIPPRADLEPTTGEHGTADRGSVEHGITSSIRGLSSAARNGRGQREHTLDIADTSDGKVRPPSPTANVRAARPGVDDENVFPDDPVMANTMDTQSGPLHLDAGADKPGADKVAARHSAETSAPESRRRVWPHVLFGAIVCLLIAGIWYLREPANQKIAQVLGEDTSAAYGPTLKIGVTRYLPEHLIKKRFDPFVAHLSKQVGLNVELVIVEDYFDLADRLVASELGVGVLSPYSYVRAKRAEPGLEVLATAVTRRGGSKYQGYILARRDSNIRSLNDLRGGSFCYVSPTSTSGYLYPRAMLLRAGVDPDEAFRTTRFAGEHLASLRALYSGACDGAAAYSNILFEADKHGMSPSSFRILATTDPIPHDAYCVRGDMPKALREKLRSEFLSLRPGSDRANQVFRESSYIVGFAPAHDEDYDSVRSVEKYIDALRERGTRLAGSAGAMANIPESLRRSEDTDAKSSMR